MDMFPLSFQSQPSAPLELLNEYNPRSLANTAHVSFSGVFAAISFFFFLALYYQGFGTSLEEAQHGPGPGDGQAVGLTVRKGRSAETHWGVLCRAEPRLPLRC